MAGPINDEDIVAGRGKQAGPALAPVGRREIACPGVAAAMDHHDRPPGGRIPGRSDAVDIDRPSRGTREEAATGDERCGVRWGRSGRVMLHEDPPDARLRGHVLSLPEMLRVSGRGRNRKVLYETSF